MKLKDETEEVTAFTESTKRQARLWDWIGRILPMAALLTVTVLHFMNEYSLRDLVLNGVLVIFLSICFIWWYWAIIKIVSSTKYLKETYVKFKELSNELRKIKKDIKQDDSNR
jgi:hypothetical protein